MHEPRAMRHRVILAQAVIGVLATSVALTAPAAAQPAAGAVHAGVVQARSCANLGVTIPLNPEQAGRARAVLPEGFALAALPTMLVETSTCEGASVNDTEIGSFHLSEAALSVEPPRAVSSPRLGEVMAENIYMLSQLDTNTVLSEYKSGLGYRSEVTDIALDLGAPDAIGRRASASAGGTIAPTTATAQLTPSLLPDAVRVPNPGIVYKLWTRDSQGRYVVTTNANMTINRPAAGVGTVTVAAGTTAHRILGSDTATGVAFSGQAERFVNDTFVFPAG
ncbi:hypothetical protein SAMN05444580_101551 [Rhodococcus tukisamuensis]|uniref:Uncharacterized protein n=2 Tax=Rhodococcus tukisamuensis TaxID=168276 RepID=A0A1G6NJX8_9NOCA|nr:hypothetical protein SAMN05444580_101551 [Rhodococcus tukisamuensis]